MITVGILKNFDKFKIKFCNIIKTLKNFNKFKIKYCNFTDFEIIVIDDGSQDNTVECVNSVTDDRIKLFSHENGGLSTARNRGIDQATGDFITFLDADDLWTADKLELQLEALRQNPNAGVAYSWVALMEADATGKYVFYPVTPYDFSGNVYVSMLLSNFMINGSNIMARREAITTTGYFAVIKSGEDWDYYIRLASQLVSWK